MSHFTAAQRRRIRRATRPEPPSPGDDELNIVPFLDVVVNLIMFLLLTMSAALAAHQVHAQLPTTDPRSPGEPTFRPTVVLAEGGVFVSSRQGHYGPGCDAAGQGPAVAIVGGEPDWLALRACAERLKAAHPEADSLTLSADPMVELQWVIAAMDALRGPSGSLYDDITLAAGVR